MSAKTTARYAMFSIVDTTTRTFRLERRNLQEGECILSLQPPEGAFRVCVYNFQKKKAKKTTYYFDNFPIWTQRTAELETHKFDDGTETHIEFDELSTRLKYITRTKRAVLLFKKPLHLVEIQDKDFIITSNGTVEHAHTAYPVKPQTRGY